MLRRALSVCAVLGMASSAFAGAAITFNAAAPADGIAYRPGEVVNVDIFAQLTAGTPSVPGPGGTTNTIRVRFIQLDFADSNPALGLTPVFHHPTSEAFGGPIPFWDLSGSTACANDETQCGTNYFIDGTLTGDNLASLTYTGLTTNGSFMVTLNQAAPKMIAELNVTLPQTPGDYILDVLNADETDPNRGADIRWGFGSTADPTDPSSPLRASNTAGGGGIVYGPGGALSFNVVPEPATLAMLGLGAVAAAYRRRRSA